MYSSIYGTGSIVFAGTAYFFMNGAFSLPKITTQGSATTLFASSFGVTPSLYMYGASTFLISFPANFTTLYISSNVTLEISDHTEISNLTINAVNALVRSKVKSNGHITVNFI